MKTFLRLMSYVKPHGRSLSLALVCMVFFALFSGFSIGMISPFMR